MPDRRRTPEEIKRSFENAKKVMAHKKKKEREVDVRWAKGALIVIGAFQVLLALYYFNAGFDITFLALDFGIGGLFIALSFHANSKPVQAITIGIASYFSVIFISALVFKTNPFNGLLIKIIVITILVSGLKSAKKLPVKKENNPELLDEDLEDSI